MLTWRKECQKKLKSMSTLSLQGGKGESMSKFARREMLDRDEHAEAMQVIEKVYSLDLSRLALLPDTLGYLLQI